MWISKQDAGSCGGIWFRCAANVIAYKFGFVWKEKTVYDCNKSLSGIMSCEKDDTIFMLELKECSKRIFDVPKFIFYGLGYAIERVLARTHSGIKGFLLKKEQSQQLTLAEYFAGLGFKW